MEDLAVALGPFGGLLMLFLSSLPSLLWHASRRRPEPAYTMERGELAWRLAWLDPARTSRATEIAIDIASDGGRETYRSPAARRRRCMTVKSSDGASLEVPCDEVAEIYLFRDPPRRGNIDLRARFGDGRKVTLIAAIPNQADAFAMATWIAKHVGVAVAGAMKMRKSRPGPQRATPLPPAEDRSPPAIRWTELADPLPPEEDAAPCSRPWMSRYAAGKSDGHTWLAYWAWCRVALAGFLMFWLYVCVLWVFVCADAEGAAGGLAVLLFWLSLPLCNLTDLRDRTIFTVGPSARASRSSNPKRKWFSVRRSQQRLQLRCAEIENVHVFLPDGGDSADYELRVKLRDGRDLIMIDRLSWAAAREIARKLARWMGVQRRVRRAIHQLPTRSTSPTASAASVPSASRRESR
jgi:hypothetical protein